MEQESIGRLKLLHPAIRNDALDAYLEAVQRTPKNIHPYITQTFRSFAESDHLYKLGRTIVNPDGKSPEKPMGDIVSWARAGQSYHNYGLALDFCLQINGELTWASDPPADKNWMIVVECFKNHGFTWGGDFPKGKEDYPHFENKLGYHWSELLAMHENSSNFIAGNIYLKLIDKTA